MKNGKYSKRRGVATKALVMVLSLMLVAGLSVGATLAWLTDTSDTVTNTFTVGDINITLQEHGLNEDGTLNTNKEVQGNSYKFIPGVNLNKDPFVTVEAGSEACWLFIKVTETDWPTTDKISYSIDSQWTELEGEDGVYYRKVDATTADTNFYILTNNLITVSEELTKEEANAITGTPKLTFVAYAIQQEGIDDAATAWEKIFA